MPSLSHNAGVRPSSTVIVAKDAVADPEIFMVRRHEQSSFGAAHAFPGGVVDAEDSEVHDYCSGLTRADANARIGVEDGGLDFYSAAVRELFEETGVLLAEILPVSRKISCPFAIPLMTGRRTGPNSLRVTSCSCTAGSCITSVIG